MNIPPKIMSATAATINITKYLKIRNNLNLRITLKRLARAVQVVQCFPTRREVLAVAE
jgi:hypothetical protein